MGLLFSDDIEPDDDGHRYLPPHIFRALRIRSRYNPDLKYYIVNFYYTIRSNVVHRGKEAGNRIDELENSLDDLLNIFDYMIEKTFADDEI